MAYDCYVLLLLLSARLRIVEAIQPSTWLMPVVTLTSSHYSFKLGPTLTFETHMAIDLVTCIWLPTHDWY